jgi:hypothetical protein
MAQFFCLKIEEKSWNKGPTILAHFLWKKLKKKIILAKFKNRPLMVNPTFPPNPNREPKNRLNQEWIGQNQASVLHTRVGQDLGFGPEWMPTSDYGRSSIPKNWLVIFQFR